MKTGAFAKKYGLKPSAVRFYIDKALLTPVSIYLTTPVWIRWKKSSSTKISSSLLKK